MISQLSGASIRSAYANGFGESKEVSQKNSLNISKQGDLDKVDQIKSAIESGEYKVNLHTLSQKIAEELM